MKCCRIFSPLAFRITENTILLSLWIEYLSPYSNSEWRENKVVLYKFSLFILPKTWSAFSQLRVILTWFWACAQMIIPMKILQNLTKIVWCMTVMVLNNPKNSGFVVKYNEIERGTETDREDILSGWDVCGVLTGIAAVLEQSRHLDTDMVGISHT